MENQVQFNTWKEDVEGITPQQQIDCLRIVELNISNICNLKCPFCPHSKDWQPTKPLLMDFLTVEKVTQQLKEINYQGYICIAGMGEPTFHPNILQIIDLLKDFKVVLVSNGTLLKSSVWNEITNKCQIKISVHDWSKIDVFKDKFKDTNAWFRNHDTINPQMNLYNRGGYLWKPQTKIIRMCNFPFYKIFIDTNGDYLRCEADWSHKSRRQYNINNTSIKDYFVNALEEDRTLMLKPSGRQNFDSCKTCDIQGTLTGQKFINFWKENNAKSK